MHQRIQQTRRNSHVAHGAWLAAALFALASGCGPKLSEADLGEVVVDPTKVPAFAKPYPMPKLDSIQRNPEGAPDNMEQMRKAMETNAWVRSGSESPPAPAVEQPPAAEKPSASEQPPSGDAAAKPAGEPEAASQPAAPSESAPPANP